MAIASARMALERSGISPEEISCIITATISGDYATPSVSCMVQQALGLPEDIPVLDVNAACSGFVYALCVAQGLLEGNSGRYGLVIGVEQLSKLLDMTDRSTCVLFGDGGGAVIVERDKSALFRHTLGARGGKQILCKGPGNTNSHIQMDGKTVFRFAVWALPKCIKELLESGDESAFELSDIKHVICHQANSRIIDHCVKKLKADPSQFYGDMDHFGNTSAGSIPLALGELYDAGRLSAGDRLMLVGFGSGLTWGGVLMTYDGR
jgi:3-oxoacyl-[acyl-carrier-protein] synthase-3